MIGIDEPEPDQASPLIDSVADGQVVEMRAKVCWVGDVWLCFVVKLDWLGKVELKCWFFISFHATYFGEGRRMSLGIAEALGRWRIYLREKLFP